MITTRAIRCECGSGRVNPINIADTVYECLDCKKRFHVGGIKVGDVLFEVASPSMWPCKAATPFYEKGFDNENW